MTFRSLSTNPPTTSLCPNGVSESTATDSALPSGVVASDGEYNDKIMFLEKCWRIGLFPWVQACRTLEEICSDYSIVDSGYLKGDFDIFL